MNKLFKNETFYIIVTLCFITVILTDGIISFIASVICIGYLIICLLWKLKTIHDKSKNK